MREPYNITFNQYRNTVTMPYIEFVVGDYMTCPLSFKWMKNDIESFNQSGTKVYLVVQTPSGKSVDDRCTINDAGAGISNILLKQDFVIEKGLHRAELQAIDIESGIVRMTSPSFSYNVRKSLQDSNTEEAKNTLTQLQEALNLVADIDVDAKLDAHDTSEIAHPHIQQEIADAKSQLNEIATEKVSKTELDSLTTKKGTWEPKLKGSEVAGIHTFYTSTGMWSKVGKQVIVDFNIYVNVWDNGATGALQIGGLPFVPSINCYNQVGVFGAITLPTDTYSVGIGAEQSNTNIRVFSNNPAERSATLTADVPKQYTILRGQITYTIA